MPDRLPRRRLFRGSAAAGTLGLAALAASAAPAPQPRAGDAIALADVGVIDVVGALDAKTGSLTAGKAADILLVEGNPLEDLGALGRVRMVLVGGRIERDLP
jgi:imidazolonepropionase-like amidohydrolase